MKSIFLFAFALLFCLALPAQTPRCDYDALMRDGEAFFKKREYKKALNKYNAAKTCDIARAAEVDVELNKVFQAIEKEKTDAIEARDLAEKRARENYANDLAYKSQIALERGDRTSAFRLAEFAFRYVDTVNNNVTRALLEALYFNDGTDTTCYLPWEQKLEGNTSIRLKVSAFSPDGEKLAAALMDSSIVIWDVGSRKVICNLKGKNPQINSLAFSADSKLLASGSDLASETKIWDLESRRVTKVIKPYGITKVAFSPDGKRLATTSSNYSITRVWDVESGANTLTLKDYGVVFSPDGRTLAIGLMDKSIKIWDMTSGGIIHKFEGHESFIYDISFSPDGKILATGSDDKKVIIWDLVTGKPVATLEGHISRVSRVIFSHDGKKLATRSVDGVIKIWDRKTWRVIHSSECFNHYGNIVFSPDNKALIGCRTDRKIIVWDFSNRKTAIELKTIKYSIGSNISFAPDSKILAVGSGSSVKIWDLTGDNLVQDFDITSDSVIHRVRSVSFSPNGKTLAIAFGNTVMIWDLSNGIPILTLNGHTNNIESITFSIDAKTLATGSVDKTVRIWDLQNGKVIHELKWNRGSITSLAFSPNSKKLATTSGDNKINLWDLENGEIIYTRDVSPVHYFEDYACSVAFSPDGKKLAIGSHNGMARIWDVKSGRVVYTLEGHSYAIWSVSLSPDNKKLATASGDNTVIIWDLALKEEIIKLKHFTDFVEGVAFSPDGKLLAANSRDGTVKIWKMDESAVILSAHKYGLAELTLSQLKEYKLENLLDEYPDNESKLIATHETWQIAAFADLYADKILKTGFPKKEDFERALRLYDYCIKSGEAPEYFAQRVAELKKVWKEKTE